jgi:hypothetical protein
VQTTKALTKATRREFQTQLKKVKARAERGRSKGTDAGAPKPPKFDGTISWAVFRRQLETVVEYNCWPRLEISIYLITALQGRATFVLHRVPKGATYEETLQALEDESGSSIWPPRIAVSQKRGPRVLGNPCKNLP